MPRSTLLSVCVHHVILVWQALEDAVAVEKGRAEAALQNYRRELKLHAEVC